ncbi:hypothetical protein, partial [Hungatella sp. SL.1.14]|uniref:hypothetical protein n=1 Tax=Hungatella sp. SL.1.14 TaxID=2963703 RepID=UPI0032E4278A
VPQFVPASEEDWGTIRQASSSARTSTCFLSSLAFKSGRNSSAIFLCITSDSQALQTPIL